MADLYASIGQNALRARESSRFGTRPLAFYAVVVDEANELAVSWQDSNSLYYKIVQALQEANVELYWLGEPKSGTNNFGPDGSDSFTIAIADDADSPSLYLENTVTWTVLGANLDGYENYLKIDATNPSLNRGQPVVFGMTDDGVVAGKTYYVYEWTTANDATYIKLSETVTQVNTDGTADYPEGVGHPGPEFMLDPAPSSNTYIATFKFYDTNWSGTAGDVQWVCCWDPDFKVINAWNLQQHISDAVSITNGFSVLRCQVTAPGIFPVLGCCC